MQDHFGTSDDFLIRTDKLAVRLGTNIEALAEVIGVGRASLFSYRSGKRPITGKAWAKLAEAERAAAPIHVEAKSKPGATRMIPVIGWAHAGEAGSYEEVPKSWQDEIPTECHDVKAFAVALEGDSMEPKFSDGDKLIIQPSEEPYSGCYVVARFKTDGVIFRRMEYAGGDIVLKPLNDGWPTTRHQPEEFSWIYPVWGRWTQIWRRR